MCILVTFYEWGHFVMLTIEYTYHFHAFLDISLVGHITVLTTEISLLSHSTTLYEGLLLLFTPILTYEIIHIIASDMVVLERMI